MLIIAIYYDFKFALLVGILYSVFLIFRYKKLGLLMVLFLCLMFLNIQIRIVDTAPISNEGKIIDVKASYYILKVNHQKVLLYSKQELSYGDRIQFNGYFEEIFSPPSKSTFSTQKYMNHRNIKYRIRDDNPKLIKQSFNIKRYIHTRIKNHPQDKYLNKILLNINDYELSESLSATLLSSGVIIRTLIYGLLLLLNKRYYEKTIFNIEIFLYILLFIIFNNKSFYSYLLIIRCMKLSNLEQLDKISTSALLILLIIPSYLYSLSFIVTTLYAFISYVKVSNIKIIQPYLVLIPIQLLTFYKCNLLELFLYPYYRILNCVCFLLACVDLVFKTTFSYTIMTSFTLKIPEVTITGRMSLILLIAWIIVSLKVLQKVRIHRIVLLCIILVMNQNQLLFNPFLVYTQLYIGQGDSAIIKYPFRKDVFLIDLGSKKQWSKLQSHLDYYGIKEIHSMLITHDDEDHSGNKNNLIEQYKVNKIIEEKGEYDFYKLKLYATNYESDDDNEASLMTYFTINGYTYLTLGDASKEVERKFLKDHSGLDYHILKLGHHGSKTSSSEELLSHHNISLVLNSSGYKNMYKHPHSSVMKSIIKKQLPYLDTQQYGDIEIKHLFKYDFVSLAK